jgi:hypothetical protein
MLVDINEIPDLGYHRIEDDGTIRVGALCRHADLERSPADSPPWQRPPQWWPIRSSDPGEPWSARCAMPTHRGTGHR